VLLLLKIRTFSNAANGETVVFKSCGFRQFVLQK
jgi:hypothetical protein